MENEIKVNEYVRTKRGIIDKVDALYGMIENTVHLENQKWFNTNNIVKHSSNLIDLIQCGDYVNGKKVDSISQGYIYEQFDFDTATAICNENNIETIVTKEQFESISYKVKE